MKFNFNFQTACVSCLIAIILCVSVNTDANAFQALPFQKSQRLPVAIESLDFSGNDEAHTRKQTVTSSLMVKPIMSESSAFSTSSQKTVKNESAAISEAPVSSEAVEQTEPAVPVNPVNRDEPPGSSEIIPDSNTAADNGAPSETSDSSQETSTSSETTSSSTEETSSTTIETSTDSSSTINADSSVSAAN